VRRLLVVETPSPLKKKKKKKRRSEMKKGEETAG
jgi:hypothetical protein